jgi:3-deoxy-D-manno-octulosonic-acid transferase
MIWLYRLFFWPMLLILLPAYLVKMFKRGGNWHLAERFGIVNPPAKKLGVKRLWLHAVSVGELNAVKVLLQQLKTRNDCEVMLSVTTTTARKLADEKFKELCAYIFTFPIDVFSGCVFKRMQPDKLILMEEELWPETLHQAAKRNVGVYLINGRVSDRSFKRMMALRWAIQRLLRKVTRIMTATAQDTDRYLSLGANRELVYQTGSLKFDAPVGAPLDEATRKSLLDSLGFSPTDTIIIGASTWAGEEETLLNAYAGIRDEFPGLKLLVVPRHAERRDEAEAAFKKSGISYHRRSAGAVSGRPDAILADTTGELSKLIQLANVVFVGRSLPPHKEGQTPIEAGAAGKPVLMGPGMSNFKLIAQSLVDEGGGIFVGGEATLKEELRKLLSDPEKRNRMGERSRAWFEKNRGATEKTLESLDL